MKLFNNPVDYLNNPLSPRGFYYVEIEKPSGRQEVYDSYNTFSRAHETAKLLRARGLSASVKVYEPSA